MMEKEYYKAKLAYENYNLNTEYKLTENILKYIKEKANQKEIEQLLKIFKREYTYDDIEKVLQSEISKNNIKYKKQFTMKRRLDNFISAVYTVSVGVVAVECYDLLECVKYMIKAIKTRNSIIISDVEYEEKDDKNLILLIVQEALRKFNVDCNIIQILPYEECDYDKCDRVIYTYENKANRKKCETEKRYIYLQDETFSKEANDEYELEKKSGRDVELIEGNMSKVIDTINENINYGAVIYTKDSKIGYRFMNLVRSKNVFVNSTLENAEEVEASDDDLLMNKKIMYEYKR